MKKIKTILWLFLLASVLLAGFKHPAQAAESYGYQLALIDARASHPQQVLMNKKITPSSAAMREFEWILETLGNRCLNPRDMIVRNMVESWRLLQRRGHKATLLEFSRQASDLANFAFQAKRNQRVDFDRVLAKLLTDKYKLKL